ncbi:FixH family protein [bacterium]|nr:FixH family protein [bacterium]
MSDQQTKEQKTKRQPWAVGITIVIVVFLIATVSVVLFISNQEYSLVTENYYEKDLAYQDEIDARQRTQQLDLKPAVVLDREAKSCSISFPERDDYNGITGTVTFFRISSARGDLVLPLELNSEGKQHISVSGLDPGQWIFKFRWMDNGEAYSMEKRMYL